MENQSLSLATRNAMNLTATDYSRLNGAQQRDALETIDKILEDTANESVDIVVDIGCGSGNVTAVLADSIKPSKLLALDIDPDMVTFAQRNCSSFEYITQDISAPWNGLHPSLASLEGKVDLVWSNRVLHWVADDRRRTAAENIVRLLKPGGRVYINTTLLPDFNEFLPRGQKEANEKIIKIPSLEQQRDSWCQYFTNLGLSTLKINFVERSWVFETPEDHWNFTKVMIIYERYISPDIPNCNKGEVLEKFRELYARTVATPVASPPAETSQNLRDWNYGQFRITGIK